MTEETKSKRKTLKIKHEQPVHVGDGRVLQKGDSVPDDVSDEVYNAFAKSDFT